MSEIVIESIKPNEILEASIIISHAFIPTPVVAAVFRGKGEKQHRKLERGMAYMMKKAQGQIYVAKVDGNMVGFMRMAKWPSC